MRYVIVNKYSEKVSGGVEKAVAMQFSCLKDFDVAIAAFDPTHRYKFRLGKWFFSLESFGRLLTLTKVHGTLIINVPSPGLELIALLYGKLMKNKIIVYFHAYWEKQSVLASFYNKVVNFLMLRADRVLVSNEAVGQHLEQTLGINTVIAPFFVKKNDFTGKLKKSTHVIYFGRLAEYKNIELIGELAKRNPSIKFCVAGPLDGSYNVDFLRHINNVQVMARFFTEHEKEALMAESEVLILPSVSKAETFGIVQLEALSAGCKVLRFDNGTGVASVCRNEDFTYTVNSNTVEHWDTGLNELFNRHFSPLAIANAVSEQYSSAEMLKGLNT